MFRHTAVGRLESFTVTVAWQVRALPAASLTCKVTVCAPVSPHPKLTESAKLASLAETVPLAILCSVTPQFSVEPFSMAVTYTLSLHDALPISAMFWHTAVGRLESLTVT